MKHFLKIVFASLIVLVGEGAHTQSTMRISLAFSKDSMKIITAVVTEEKNTGGKEVIEHAVKDADVNFFAKRWFSLLPLGKPVSTNDQGMAEITFPNNLPGDKEGNVVVVAQVEDEDNDTIHETHATIKWGVPLKAEKDPFPRAMWEPRAPVWLIVTLSVLFGGIWATYFFVAYQLHRIRKQTS